jgi:GNAT superfamily N-acetyltransferase
VVAIRPTEPDDLPALHRLFREAIAGVYRPHGFEPPAPPLAVFEAQQRHILDTGCSRVAVQHGEPAGFASAWRRGGDWFLASLFVSPRAQASGLGSALLDAVWDEGAERRWTITDAIQPVSNALYARRGLIPATPVLDLAGMPGVAHPDGLVPGDGETAPIDLAAYGFDRSADHAAWAAAGERTVWCCEGTPVAYAYRFPGGAIGPVAGLDAHAAADALAAELARAGGEAHVRVPGSARALVSVALAAGLRLGPTPGLLLCSAGATPPAAIAIGSYTLF